MAEQCPLCLLVSPHRCVPLLRLCAFASEWGVNMHRDTYASHLGHYSMVMHTAVAENESIGRVKYNHMQVS